MNAPAATVCAEVIVVSASLRPVKLSHEAATAGLAAKPRIAARMPEQRICLVFILFHPK
jgi:hypothetical protein